MAGKRCVLIVEDDPAIRRTLERVFSRSNYDLKLAPGGLLGLEAARRHHPDAVILDVMMPDIDGYEVFESLRSDPDTRDIPVLILSSLSDPANRAYGVKSGVNAYMGKPFSSDELRTCLADLMKTTDSAQSH